MSLLHLVTGHAGQAHITSADEGRFNAQCIGTDEYVLAYGKQFKAEIIDNNNIRVYDGSLLMNGRFVTMSSGAYEMLTISSGSQSLNRNDLIVARYTRNTETNIEDVFLTVIKGTAVSETASDPAYNTTSILGGVTIHDMPLYRVKLSGINITALEPMFDVLVPLADVQKNYYRQNMVINGDFRCNQRGKGVYDIDDTKAAYTLDMWRAFNVRVDVLPGGGVKLTGKSAETQGYFTQFVPLDVFATTTYTISARVDSKLYTFTLTPGADAKEQNFGTFKISALTTSTWNNTLNGYDNRLKINICPIGTNAIIVSYVDCVVGNVAYPHIKEDALIALTRCKRHIQSSKYLTIPIWSSTTIDRAWAHRVLLSFDPMHTTPSIRAFDGVIHTEKSDVTFNKSMVVLNDISSFFVDLEVSFEGTSPTSNAMLLTNFIVSCEHKPDGD